MVGVNSSNELLQTIPVRPARPMASRNAQQEDQQNQIVEQATRQQNVVQDEDINRALLAYEQRNQQQKSDSSTLERDALENNAEYNAATGYDPSGYASGANASSYAERGTYIDFYA
eukprot:TRINITY_DN19750_c0_g1_i1.p1 TRINITY_DN19750_c0_g1~~TRINITY_DN19750_c0_g1_i1.p1  ORF type:complete len:116 (-),score=20.88 TRINITY_DN19750_c0_g1_i1:103-450(-)